MFKMTLRQIKKRGKRRKREKQKKGERNYNCKKDLMEQLQLGFSDSTQKGVITEKKSKSKFAVEPRALLRIFILKILVLGKNINKKVGWGNRIGSASRLRNSLTLLFLGFADLTFPWFCAMHVYCFPLIAKFV